MLNDLIKIFYMVRVNALSFIVLAFGRTCALRWHPETLNGTPPNRSPSYIRCRPGIIWRRSLSGPPGLALSRIQKAGAI